MEIAEKAEGGVFRGRTGAPPKLSKDAFTRAVFCDVWEKGRPEIEENSCPLLQCLF